MRKVIKANYNNPRDYAEDTVDLEQQEYSDWKALNLLKGKMSDLFDALEDTRRGFLADYDLTNLYNELSSALYTTAHEIEPFDDVYSSTRITASAGSKIPVPLNKYYRVATKSDLDEWFGDIDEDKSPCEECEGYDAKNVGWAIAKDKYADALGDDGIDIVELVKFGKDNEIKLAYVVHDRIYTIDEDDIERIIDEQ